MITIQQLAEATGGAQSGGDAMVTRVSINTRADCSNSVFIALKGDNFDAHDFLDNAIEAGARAVMVERDIVLPVPVVRVKDTHKALMDLAAWWRSQFAIPVFGITGSVGKTTVKEMLGAIMRQHGRGVVTEGNLNNEIGVPLTLMRLETNDRYAVIEMGMNHAGEISRLTAVARPTVALVNNAAAAHLEGLGTVEAVAKAKGEIFEGLTEDGIAVINVDDKYSDMWSHLAQTHRQITFGLQRGADVSASYVEKDGCLVIDLNAFGERGELTLRTLGEHNVRNVLAAVAMASAANVPLKSIIAGLENYSPIKGRLNAIQLTSGLLFDDTYNANPASMQAAIRVLSAYKNAILVVGDMAELGEASKSEHIKLGEFANKYGISKLLCTGAFAQDVVEGFKVGGRAFETQEELIEHLLLEFEGSAAVLVKGSRSAKMENVVNALIEHDRSGSSNNNDGVGAVKGVG